jgi:cell division protein FtsX
VGLPRLSRISRPMMSTMAVMLALPCVVLTGSGASYTARNEM